MYGIIHKEIFDSTIMAEGYEVTYVFMSLVTLADGDDCVKMTPSTLAMRIAMPLEKVEHALDRLEKPDPDSESSDHDGKRILTLKSINPDFGRGWFVVNREKYVEKTQKINRNNYMREFMREKREREKANKVGGVSSQLAHKDIDINKDKYSKSIIPPSVDHVKKYCDERGNGIDHNHFHDYYQARNWVLKNGQKMKDWQAAVRTWEKGNKKEKVDYL